MSLLEVCSSRVANHLGASVAIVDVGTDLDHSRAVGVVGAGQLFGTRTSQAADDGDLYGALCGIHAVSY